MMSNQVRSFTSEGYAMLEVAKRRLDAMDYVGTTDRFEDSVSQWSQCECGWYDRR